MRNFISIALIILMLTIISQSVAQNNGPVYSVRQLVEGKFMHDFLLIGPFPNPLPNGVKDYFHVDKDCIGFARDYLTPAGGESGIQPESGQTISYGDNKLCTWQTFHSETDKVDLKKIFTPNEGVVAYAALWLESESQQEKLFGIGSNDGIKVWLNGRQILNEHKPRPVSTDDEYLRLTLKKGRNLLLLKICQGYGGWGFILRPVNNAIAWKRVRENLDVALNSEFYVEDGFIKGTVGDKNIVGALGGLPMADIEFQSINSKHTKNIRAPLGSFLELPQKEFPASEYAITISFITDQGPCRYYGYMGTTGDIIEQYRELVNKKLPAMPLSAKAVYYKNYIDTARWLDRANKLWRHPYGYRRYLDGLKNAHDGALKLSKSNNPYDGVFPAPREINLTRGHARITSDWNIYDDNKSDDFIATELGRVWNLKFGTTPGYAATPNGNHVIHLTLTDSKKLHASQGSYLLCIAKNKITIQSRSKQGLYYGVNSFVQALEQNTNLPNGEIIDWPQYPLRSSLGNTSALTPEFKRYLNQLARLRFNVIYIYSGNYLNLNNKQKLKDIEEVYGFCKSRFIEPVPIIETFGTGTITRVIDSCLDEGVYHEKELRQIPANGVVELDVPRILDCPGTTIHLFAKDGDELVRDVDYKILSTIKPKLQILDYNLFNAEVLLSYDAVDFSSFPHPASCPSDPRGWKIQEDVIFNILTRLRPKSLHISQDEVGFVNMDSRCKARGLSNKEIMIDQINRVYDIIRKYDKNVDVHMWGDMFNDFQNAPVIGAEGAVEGLPNDIIIHDWNYIAVYHSDRMKTINQLKFYLDRGYRTGGVVWFEPANILDILLAAEKHPDQFIGIMHTAWNGFGQSLMPTAQANWTGNTIMGKLDF